MAEKFFPLLAQHESWISLDPIEGCPAACTYCYLGPPKVFKQAPHEPTTSPEALYQKLQDNPFFEKSGFDAVAPGRSFPIAIGNYTDMCLTSKNREYLLKVLRTHKSVLPDVPVCVVTKASLSQEFLELVNKIDIKVIFCISLSFLPTNFEKGTPSSELRLHNFERIAPFSNIKAIHFWRPVTSLSVPNREVALKQIESLKKVGAQASVITGLKFGPNLANLFGSDTEHPLHSYFSANEATNHLKNEIFEPEIREVILSAATEMSYPVFLHTSCAVSSVLEEPEYNGTFRLSHLETKCLPSTCPAAQRERCFSFKNQVQKPSQALLHQVADYLGLSATMITYSEDLEVIQVKGTLTQEQQTFLTQASSFPIRGEALTTTLEWVGSINR